ncbi:hypothetical protein GE061_004385 [Apolygus lucorum]|uniref:RING-CH-type domain-containing protein n=1 Tax=Apolygus lucorum TaxID=248454 RepID=A0A8S9X0J6_APOLU|nr:hypothetical protein GE061_004385 [Apolygus lucorum]
MLGRTMKPLTNPKNRARRFKMVTRRPRLPGESQRKRPSPPSIVESAEATTTDNEESDVSQITVLNTVLSSTITPSSSTSSLPIAQMPSVIDLTANSQKEAANDTVMSAGKMNPPNSIQGIGTNFQFSNGEIKRNPLQTEDALQKLTEPLRTASQNNFAQAPPGFLKTRSQGRYESSVFCRICHEIGSTDIFISPCNCKGSLSLVHKHCLERWLAESNTSLCELCGYEYNTKRLPK